MSENWCRLILEGNLPMEERKLIGKDFTVESAIISAFKTNKIFLDEHTEKKLNKLFEGKVNVENISTYYQLYMPLT